MLNTVIIVCSVSRIFSITWFTPGKLLSGSESSSELAGFSFIRRSGPNFKLLSRSWMADVARIEGLRVQKW